MAVTIRNGAVKRIKVKPGDRIDTLAVRAYGDPWKYRLLIGANPHLDIWEPKAGMVIEVPNA